MTPTDKPTQQGTRFWQSLGMLVVGGLVLFSTCVGALLLTVPRFIDPCANEPLQTSFSPDGKLKVILFRRDCGATTTYSTHVSILPASAELPNEAGNVSIQDGEPLTNVRWMGDRHLNISGTHTSGVFLRMTNQHGVAIAYE
jgi:hypothetical protein